MITLNSYFGLYKVIFSVELLSFEGTRSRRYTIRFQFVRAKILQFCQCSLSIATEVIIYSICVTALHFFNVSVANNLFLFC